MTPIAASIYFLPVRKFDKVYTHAVDAVGAISTPGFRIQLWMIMGKPSFMRQLINHTVEAELNKYE
jgi:hypothetical protein